jgi:VanZ family protein
LKYLATILVTVVILTAVLLPGSKIPDTSLPWIDKLVHFILFTSWTVAIVNDFRLKWYMALVAALLFALFTELIQLPVEGRTFDFNDLIADGAGVIFGLANADFIIRITRKLLRR